MRVLLTKPPTATCVLLYLAALLIKTVAQLQPIKGKQQLQQQRDAN